jgi:hypothetical protein
MPERHKANRGKHTNVLRLPDLDHSKASVLQSLEPRLAFGRTVVLRYRYELEARRLAPATINLTRPDGNAWSALAELIVDLNRWVSGTKYPSERIIAMHSLTTENNPLVCIVAMSNKWPVVRELL